jgi:hypothetical protein
MRIVLMTKIVINGDGLDDPGNRFITEIRAKVVLTKRIRWFQDSNGSPSFNHCWMIWDRQHRGPPTLSYMRATT